MPFCLLCKRFNRNKLGVQIGRIKGKLQDGKGVENKILVILEKKIVKLGQLDKKYKGKMIVLTEREYILNKREKRILKPT